VLAIANWEEQDDPLFEVAAAAIDGLLTLRAGAPPRDRDRPLPARVAWPAGIEPSAPLPLYATPAGLVTTTARDDGFELEFAGLDFRANPRADAWYRVRYDLLGVLPIGFSRLNRVLLAPARIAGEPVLLGFAGDRYLLAGTALARDPALAQWSRWCGTYRLTNPDALSELAKLSEASLNYADGVLTLGYEADFVVDLSPRLPLLALGDGLFAIAGRGANQGEQVRLDTTRDPPRIHYSGYVLERVP
jgi:hypothetical protein